MIALILFLACLFVVAGTGVLAAYSDFRGMTIPNSHSAIIIAAFFVCYAGLWLLGREDVFGSLYSHLLSAAIVFVVTLILFAVKAIGAGDSKLATAFALWTGLKGLFIFLGYMAIIGGLLAVVALYLQKKAPVKEPREGGWVAKVQGGEGKVPYGIAIVGGVLASFVKIGYLNVEMLSSFVMG